MIYINKDFKKGCDMKKKYKNIQMLKLPNCVIYLILLIQKDFTLTNTDQITATRTINIPNLLNIAFSEYFY
ncbi:hypothetical protein BpHYR1_001308 [Brachionus plicatilis]|uniref:Uncharacterized protein n=1 Tax=Brachionus plicatilis TaxID=10195 RepID=A0A3M7T782_BRAPC|nr:hypothetical protein BpHYR1_001308 [Brachionus plicatilis]